MKELFKNNMKEVIYFFLIYVFTLFPVFILFQLIPNKEELRGAIFICLTLTSIPASFYTEYSYRAIGYLKSRSYAFATFSALSSALLLLINFDYELYSAIFNIVCGLILLISIVLHFTYFNDMYLTFKSRELK